MSSFYQTQIYLKGYRSPTKVIQHWCTGETELQRISKNISFDNLEYSLSHSKMLRNFLMSHPLHEQFNAELFEQLCQIKGIVDNRNKFEVKKVLRQFHCYKYALNYLQKLRKIKYSAQNQQHEKKLLQIWENLKPKQKLKNRISDQWISIGFQVSDPSTDFRGAGYLGLQNLMKFTRNKKCQKVFQTAIHPQTEYFFCSAGLYFTMLAIDLMRQKLIPVQFWQFDQQQEISCKFQLVYNMLFLQFDKFWYYCEDKSMMQFNSNLKQFESQVKKNSAHHLKSLIIYWEQI